MAVRLKPGLVYLIIASRCSSETLKTFTKIIFQSANVNYLSSVVITFAKFSCFISTVKMCLIFELSSKLIFPAGTARTNGPPPFLFPMISFLAKHN